MRSKELEESGRLLAYIGKESDSCDEARTEVKARYSAIFGCWLVDKLRICTEISHCNTSFGPDTSIRIALT